MVFLQTC